MRVKFIISSVQICLSIQRYQALLFGHSTLVYTQYAQTETPAYFLQNTTSKLPPVPVVVVQLWVIQLIYLYPLH